MENHKGKRNDLFEKIMSVAMPIFAIVLGIFMLVNPVMTQYIFLVFCLLILECGIIEITIYYAVRPYAKKRKHFRNGVILVIGGIVLLLAYYLTNMLLPFCVGLLLCVRGAFGVYGALQLKSSCVSWQASMAISGLVFLMGIAVLIFTFFTDWIWILTGVLLIISGLLWLISLFFLSKADMQSGAESYIDVTVVSDDTENP
jgi:uncharacterized membrane protein HdeD (DUF308 family)